MRCLLNVVRALAILFFVGAGLNYFGQQQYAAACFCLLFALLFRW